MLCRWRNVGQRERRVQQTRNVLLDAAEELFARKGFGSASQRTSPMPPGTPGAPSTASSAARRSCSSAVIERHRERFLKASRTSSRRSTGSAISISTSLLSGGVTSVAPMRNRRQRWSTNSPASCCGIPGAQACCLPSDARPSAGSASTSPSSLARLARHAPCRRRTCPCDPCDERWGHAQQPRRR